MIIDLCIAIMDYTEQLNQIITTATVKNEPLEGSSDLDTTEKFNEYFANKCFDSWSSFETTLKAFEVDTNSVFKRRNATSVECVNKYRKEPIPERFMYASVRFVCQHFGLPRKRGNGLRVIQSYMALDCPVFFMLAYTKGSLKVSKSVMCHENHTLDEEKNKYLSCKRRLTTGEIKCVRDVVRLGPSNAFIKSFIREKFNKLVSISDVKNLKKKLKAENVQSLYMDSLKMHQANSLNPEVIPFNPSSTSATTFTTTSAAITEPICPLALMGIQNQRIPDETIQRFNLALSRSSNFVYEKHLAQLGFLLQCWEQEEEVCILPFKSIPQVNGMIINGLRREDEIGENGADFLDRSERGTPRARNSFEKQEQGVRLAQSDMSPDEREEC